MESIQIQCPPGFKIAYNVVFNNDLGDYHQLLIASDFIQCQSIELAIATVNGLIADNETVTRPKMDICIHPVFIKE